MAVKPVTWMGFFNDFFMKNQERIDEAMYPDGCREGWLQNEIFTSVWFDDDFAVNYYPLHKDDDSKSNSCKVDLYGEHPQKMVGEIKIVAQQFDHTCIAGRSGLNGFSGEGRNVLCQAEDLRNAGSEGNGSILKDVFRLNSIQAPSIEKYMILLIPIYEEPGWVDEDMDNALKNITFAGVDLQERSYLNENGHGFKTRIWQLA